MTKFPGPRSRYLERQIFNDILPLIHIAARNDYFKIINHLDDGETPGNNDDTCNMFASGDPVCCVIWHGASIMANDNARLLRCPSQQIWIGSIAKTDLMGSYASRLGTRSNRPRSMT